MKLYKRVLKLHQFRNLGKNLPTELLLNSNFEKHGGLVILVGENNVGKSNILEALKAFNDTNSLYAIENYEEQIKKPTILSLIDAIENNQQLEMLSWAELKESKENEQNNFEMNFCPFERHKSLSYDKHTDNFTNKVIQSVREALEELLPDFDDTLSHKKYCKDLKNFCDSFLSQYKEALRLNEMDLNKYIKPIENTKDKKKAKVAYKNFKEKLLLHIFLTFKEYSLSKLIESSDKNNEILEKMRARFKERSDRIKNRLEQPCNTIPKDPKKQVFLLHLLPEITNCDNPFELKDEDLSIDTSEISFSAVKNMPKCNKVWQAVCEWCDKHWLFVGAIIELTNIVKEPQIRARIELKIDENKKTLLIIIDKINCLEIDLQETSSNEFIASENDKYIKYNNPYTFNKPEITMFLNKRYDVVFNFYGHSKKFLFCKKTNLLEELEKELKKMGEKINKKFNENYCINPDDGHRYVFEFCLKEQHFLHIKIKRDNEYLELAKQSTGFQWFFNLFFNFLYKYHHNYEGVPANYGERIVAMDEPATHLSVPARKEFRKFLKEYAHKHNVTFVLATHDPFLVDTDHLDEIRIVEKETEGSAIKNNFNYSLKNDASKDSDALYQIKRSLGVSQNVFHNPQKHRIIFVEGTTDYCYLSAFKLYFNEREFKNNPIPFTFLPISGLKKNQTDMQKTIQKLRELDNNPIILIDDDIKKDNPDLDPQNAKSEQFKKANEEMPDPITILQLSSCDENFKQIEDLFTKKDRQKYLLNNKKRNLAMAFKARLLYSGKDDVVTEETKENFKKLFEKLFEWIKEGVKQPND
ncbi:AAA family ATPase [Helicobacter pylori]|uniref:AAA family ATPase n=1 Tax=Helicobacter pylori TaxID=210 RepID=UPI0019218062|nr:AAA family ATPase [Helicobacter pylori]